MRVSSKMRIFSFDRCIFCTKFPMALHIEIYTALDGFLVIARLSGESRNAEVPEPMVSARSASL